MKKIAALSFIMILLSTFAFAEDTGADPSIYGLEIEKLLNLGSGLLAFALFITTMAAYKKKKNKRLLYVSVAFFLFSVKGFLTSLELFSLDITIIDPIASVLNFAILLCFFFGVIKK
ncbi:MAG: hypothetical protein NDI94_04395 [Candidatus Woesearchaeota archaeon]|nr:hypothetical protein [Candidatus Woesearchaeota archaeon]